VIENSRMYEVWDKKLKDDTYGKIFLRKLSLSICKDEEARANETHLYAEKRVSGVYWC